MPPGSEPQDAVVLPREVESVCARFLDLCDEELPGQVEGLYLHGSLGFGEWFAHTSDIDFIAVSSARLDPDLLHRIHERLRATFPAPSFDGSHVLWSDLAQSPSVCPEVPGTIGGVWEDEGRVDLSPVTWHELAHHGVRVRGPALFDVPLHAQRSELRRHTRESLAGYWADLVAGLADFPAEAGRPEMVTWTVLGTARLRHVLAHDELTSKSAAGWRAIHDFGESWRPLVTEAVCWRELGTLAGTYEGRERERARDTIEFTRMVVDDALAIPEERA